MIEQPPHERHLASHLFNLAMLAVGGVALWWMIRSIGWHHVTDAVRAVGPWFAAILALDLLSMACDAAALHAFMRPESRMVSYLRVLGAQASGRAINVLTPGAALGEATKLTMLVSRAPRARVLSSIVLLNLAIFYLSVLGIAIGTPIVLLLVDLPPELRIVVGAGLAVLLPLVIGLGVLVRRGALTSIVRGARRIGLVSGDRADRWTLRLAEVDRHLRELYAHRSGATRAAVGWLVLSKLTWWGSTFLLYVTVGVALDAALVVGAVSIGVLITWIAQLVPLGLGVAEGGNYALFDLLGASGPHGVVVTMLNRARSLAVAMLGLAAMAVMHVLNRRALARMNRRLDALRARAHAG